MGADQSRPGQPGNAIHDVKHDASNPGVMISMARQRSLELAKSIFSDKEQLRELWHRCDANANGIASLAEVDKMVIELATQTRHDHDLYHGFFAGMADTKAKMGIMRAYKWTLKKEKLSNHDDYIQAHEFPALLKNLYFFSTLQKEFEKADSDNDHKVSKEEFKIYLTSMGFHLDKKQLDSEFQNLDADESGFASPLEFYGYCMRALAMTDKHVRVKGDFMNVGYATSSKGRANDYRGKTHHDTRLSSHISPHHAYHSAYHHAPAGAHPPPPAHAHHPALAAHPPPAPVAAGYHAPGYHAPPAHPVYHHPAHAAHPAVHPAYGY